MVLIQCFKSNFDTTFEVESQLLIIIILWIYSEYFKILNNGKYFPFCPDGLPLKSEKVFPSLIQKGLDIGLGNLTVWRGIELTNNLNQG